MKKRYRVEPKNKFQNWGISYEMVNSNSVEQTTEALLLARDAILTMLSPKTYNLRIINRYRNSLRNYYKILRYKKE